MAEIYVPTATTLGDVLDGSQRLVIPDYQREYNWAYNDQVEELYSDLKENYERGSDNAYLLGPIVLNDTNMPTEIVDGQQRLVTLTLWMCALRDYLKSNEDKFVMDSPRDKEDYDEIISKITKCVLIDNHPIISLNHNMNSFESICVGIDKKSIKNTIITNYNSLLKKISGDCDEILKNKDNYKFPLKEISKRVDHMKTMTKFVQVKICDQKYVYDVFTSLNSKGQELKQTDLIKSKFLSKTIDDVEKKSINGKWKEFTDNELIKKNIDDFFYHSVLSRDKDVQKNRMYNPVNEKIEFNNKSENNHEINMLYITQYLKDRCEDIKIYEMLADPNKAKSDPRIKNDSEYSHIFYGLNQVGVKYFYRVIIAAYRIWGPIPNTKILLGCILKFFFMYKTICKKDIDVLKSIAKNATSDILNGKSLSVVLKTILINDKGHEHVTTDEFKKEFPEKTDLNQKIKKYILYSLEYYLQRKTGVTIAPTQEYELEHIFPKNPDRDKWPNMDEFRDVDRLGNMTLLDPNWNKAIKNHSFEDKKNKGDKCYSKSGLVLNKYFINITKWDMVEIEKREKVLFDDALKVWDLSEYITMAENSS